MGDKMKQFKFKKIRKKRFTKIKMYVFIFLFIFSYFFVLRFCAKNKFKNEVLTPNMNFINFNIKDFVLTSFDYKINKPISFLNYNIKSAVQFDTKKSAVKESPKKESDTKEVGKETINLDTPLVYIYNTHQSESYVDYSVYDAANVLSDKLNGNGISTYFERQSVTAFLQTNKLKYYESYKVSKKYLSEAKNKHSTLTYFFDIHRDSVSKNLSTLNYEGKNYAKVLLIVGTDNPGYNNNLSNAEKLNTIISSKIPGISRGIMKKGGKGVDGVYNQDISPNSFLIEVGSNYNSKEEVLRTINVIYESIVEYLGDNK